jgi:hypothetical protein
MTDVPTVIDAVSETLRSLLNEKVVPELQDPNSIVFDSPADVQQLATPRLSLFLYLISDNPFSKNQEPEHTDSGELLEPPLSVDLRYLLTPFSKSRLTEQIILEKAMRVFHDNPILPSSILPEALRETGNKELKVMWDSRSILDMRDIWSIFPSTPYRLSVLFEVTPVKIRSSARMHTRWSP